MRLEVKLTWSHHNKADPWSQVHDKSVRSTHTHTHYYNPLCWRILLRSSSSEGPMYHSSSAAWQKHRSCLQHLQKDVMLKKQQKCYVLSIPKEYWLWWLSLMRRRKDRARCSSLWGATWGWCYSDASHLWYYGSCNSCLWMLCASSSSLVTSRSMPGWLLSTLQEWLLFRSQIQTYIKNSWVDPILCHRSGSCSRVHQPHHDSHWGLVGISQNASVLLGTRMRSVSGRECTRSNWRRWKVQGSQCLTRKWSSKILGHYLPACWLWHTHDLRSTSKTALVTMSSHPSHEPCFL